jgi:hypothetical protein
MRTPAFIALGLGFILIGAGLFALTLRKSKPLPANPTKTQLREQAAIAAESKKMRIGAAAVAGIGVAAIIFGFI